MKQKNLPSTPHKTPHKITALLLALCLFCPSLPFSVQANTLWDLEFYEISQHSHLETTEIVGLYTGDMQEVLHSHSPSSFSYDFLLLTLRAEKTQDGTESFLISDLSLWIDKVEYKQIQGGFVEDHNYDAFPTTPLSFGAHTGTVVIESPTDSDLENAYVQYQNQVFDLELSEIRDDNDKTNIKTLENLLETQWEHERQIRNDYDQESYTLQDPYIVMNPYLWAELTALVLFDTEQPAQLTVSIQGKDDLATISHHIPTFETFHQVPVVGLYADYNNKVTLSLLMEDGTRQEKTLQIQTAPLKNSTMLVDLSLQKSQPEKMAEGFNFLVNSTKSPLVVDHNGDIRWILDHATAHIFTRIENGNIILNQSDGSGFYEMDMLGKIYNIYQDPGMIHHDVIELPNGNFLTTSQYSDSVEDRLVELDRQTGEVVWDLDLKSIFPTERIFNLEEMQDWFHLNAVVYDESDQSLILSGRHYGIAKIAYPSGGIIWQVSVASNQDNDPHTTLRPLDSDFKLPSAQHTPSILPDFDNNPNTLDLLVYDNNSAISPDFTYEGAEEYSQLVHYRIDEVNRTIEQIWSYGEELGRDYFTIMVGDADYLPGGNILGTFGFRDNVQKGAPNYENTATILEVVPETGEVVFVLDVLFDNASDLYRSHRLSLYPTTWDYQLLTTKGVAMAKNQQDKYQTDYTIQEITPPAESLWEVENRGYVQTFMDETYDHLEVTGWVILDNIDSQKYSPSLLLQGKNQSYQIPLEKNYNTDYGLYLSRTLELEQDLNYATFSMSVPLDFLQESMPGGVYDLHILLDTPILSTVHKLGAYFTLEKEVSTLENTDVLDLQNQISQSMENSFNPRIHTLENPLIYQNPYGTSPLSALFAFSTDESGTMEVTIQGKTADTTLVHKFSTFTDTHFLPIYGLYPDYANQVTLRFISEKGETQVEQFTLYTEKLPDNVQNATVNVADTDRMKDGLVFLSTGALTCAYDHRGEVRWYLTDLAMNGSTDLEFLANGNLALLSSKMYHPAIYACSAYEIDFLGRIYTEYVVNGAHHEIQELSNGDLIFATEKDENHIEDYIVKMDRDTGDILDDWDLKDVLSDIPHLGDSTYEYGRTTDMALTMPQATWNERHEIAQEETQLDWFHNNAVYYDQEKNTILASGRVKDIVIEFDAYTGDLLWILSDPTATWASAYEDYFLTPIGDNFSYAYGVHSVFRLENGNICLFDNGNFRSKDFQQALDPEDNYSRCVVYEVNQEDMTVRQIYEYGRELGSKAYSSYVSNVQELGEEHFLVNFGGISMDSEGNILNSPQQLFSDFSNRGVTLIHEVIGQEVVFELYLDGIFFGNAYRAFKNHLYSDDTKYHNLSHTATRLGDGKETLYETLEEAPTPGDNVDFTLISAQDQGDRVGITVEFHNFLTSDTFLVLQNGADIRLYPYESESTVFLNKAGLLSGAYTIGVLATDSHGKHHYSQSNLSFTIQAEQVPSFIPPSVLAEQQESQHLSPAVLDFSGLFVAVICLIPLLFLALQKKEDRPDFSKREEEIA